MEHDGMIRRIRTLIQWYRHPTKITAPAKEVCYMGEATMRRHDVSGRLIFHLLQPIQRLEAIEAVCRSKQFTANDLHKTPSRGPDTQRASVSRLW
jgi:DNA-binding phage protein